MKRHQDWDSVETIENMQEVEIMRFKELLQVQTATGPSVTVGDVTVTPQS